MKMNNSEAFAVAIITVATCTGWLLAGYCLGNYELDKAVEHAYKHGLQDGKAIQDSVSTDGPEANG